jgi:arylsulfatase
MPGSIPLNILHLFTDQQRFDSIAAHGNAYIRTPNLDRLVHEGTSFQRAYSPSPECVPARCCMITGHYPGRTGCYSNTEDMPPEEQPSFMHYLNRAEYLTHAVGKCHFTPDPYANRGFCSRMTQEELPPNRIQDDYARHLVKGGDDWILEPHGIRGEMYYIPQPSLLPETRHPSHWVADRSIEFIQQQAKGTQPWYLFSSFIHPHPPFTPPVPWHKLYRGPDMPKPEIPTNLDDLICFVNRIQNRYKYRDHGGLDLNLIRQIRAYYYACISFIDKQVGRIIESLESTGQLDRTLIVFSSDHGEYLGDYGCFGKRGMHDASARIPMIIRWPDGSHSGTRPDTPVSLVDLAPTVLEAAGIHFDTTAFDGESLRQVADGKTNRTAVFSQYNRAENGLYMAVESDWKYVFSAADQKEYLFDLTSDPKEHCNLASTTLKTEKLTHLRKICQDWVWQGKHSHEALYKNGNWRRYPIRRMPTHPDKGLIYQDPQWWDGQLPG